MTHIEQRLQERNIAISHATIAGLCYECDVDTAVIISKGEHMGQDYGRYTERNESNGDLVVLIIRNHAPVTVMYRRSSQTNTCEQLRVNQIIDIT